MKKSQNQLALQHFDKKTSTLSKIDRFPQPSNGWVKTVRMLLNMSLRQLGKRLDISAQSAREIEQREMDGSITLKSLRDAADALEMKVVYVLLPKDGTIEKLIEKRAGQIAREIVMRTSHSMILEEQGNSDARIEKSIKAKTEEIKNTMPKYLWD